MNINRELDNIELFCDFINKFPNLVGEAFNLIAVMTGYRTGYLFKSNNYKYNHDRYDLIREYIMNLDCNILQYTEIIDNNIPKFLIYNSTEIEKSSDLLNHLENILNIENNSRIISLNNLLDHMCPNQLDNFRGSIEFYIKNYNKTFYKEYWNQCPDNTIIAEKKLKFQELATQLNLVIDIKIDRYLSNNEIVDILLKKNPQQYLMYKNEINNYLKKIGLMKTLNIINRINTLDKSLEILQKYHRKIGVLITITSIEIYSIYYPFNTLEKNMINKILLNMENNIYNMNVDNITTNRISIIVLSYIKEIILILHSYRLNENLFDLCNQNIQILYNKLL